VKVDSDTKSIEDYRRFLDIKSLPSYQIKGIPSSGETIEPCRLNEAAQRAYSGDGHRATANGERIAEGRNGPA
jgi:hypothetical protein